MQVLKKLREIGEDFHVLPKSTRLEVQLFGPIKINLLTMDNVMESNGVGFTELDLGKNNIGKDYL